jgi:hypothetical protein
VKTLRIVEIGNLEHGYPVKARKTETVIEACERVAKRHAPHVRVGFYIEVDGVIWTDALNKPVRI